LGVYARTKLIGEQEVERENPESIIARVNFYGFSLRGNRSLAETFLWNLESGKEMNGFTDVFFCSLYVMNLAEKLVQMLDQQLKGLFHTVSRECVSKYEFGVRLARKFGFNEKLITPISVNESGLVAKRSPNLCLNVSKLEKALGMKMPIQDEGLEGFYSEFRLGKREELRRLLSDNG